MRSGKRKMNLMTVSRASDRLMVVVVMVEIVMVMQEEEEEEGEDEMEEEERGDETHALETMQEEEGR